MCDRGRCGSRDNGNGSGNLLHYISTDSKENVKGFINSGYMSEEIKWVTIRKRDMKIAITTPS